MSQQASTREDNLYDTKDYKIILMLMTYKLIVQKTIPEGRKFRFYFILAQAAPYVVLWNSGKPLPVSDIRDVFQAQDTFNACIHDGVR